MKTAANAMQFRSIAASWEQNPAEMKAIFAQQPLQTLILWADRAAGEKMWLLASVLYTAASIKIMAVNTHCIRQAAASVKPGKPT